MRLPSRGDANVEDTSVQSGGGGGLSGLRIALGKAPLIGVSTGFTDYGDYLGLAFTRPLVALSAVPVVLPYVTDPLARTALLDRLDGLVFAVGRDIEPARYGALSGVRDTSHSRHRDASELALMSSAIERGLPILGVCRGMQILNIALGGSLHADHSVLSAPADAHPGGDWEVWDKVVAATLAGSRKPQHPAHAIEIVPGSALASALGTRRTVTSYHHQSLDRLGVGLVATARALDGVVEAIELPTAPTLVLGVQWELQEDWLVDAGQLDVFGLLVEAARR